MSSKKMKISGKTLLSIVTAVMLIVILYFSRHEFVRAWNLLGSVDLRFLLLLVPLQIISYYATGEILFSFLRKQKRISHISTPKLIQLSLEMNFVNHILPSAGVSGISYMGWRLKQFGISAKRSSMSQIIRFIMTFYGYATLLVFALIYLLFSDKINAMAFWTTAALMFVIGSLSVMTIFLFSKEKRVVKFSDWLTKTVNKTVKFFTFGKRKQFYKSKEVLRDFFDGLKEDYEIMVENKKILLAPYIWSVLFATTEIAMFICAFAAIGTTVNVAFLIIAYGIATLSAAFVVTPGGSGAYEAVMVGFLVAVGVRADAAIAAVVLARVVLIVGTILFGYVFYQKALMNNGKSKSTSDSK